MGCIWDTGVLDPPLPQENMNEKHIGKLTIVQNDDLAIEVLFSVGVWMKKAGIETSKWWEPKNLNGNFLFNYAKPEEFYVVLIDLKPAGAMVLQTNENSQDWSSVDKDNKKIALYIHWLGIKEEFKGKGLSQQMINFAEKLALSKGISLLRIDTNAKEEKLRQKYENLGFSLLAEIKEDYRKTAFYQKKIKNEKI